MIKKKTKVIIAGGGTGGHIFPAVAIAEALKKKDKTVEILFVGSKYRMEMDIIPKLGYNIIGLPIRGFNRRRMFSNIKTPFLLFISLMKSFFIILRFKPNVLVGVGGFASFPVLFIASLFNKPFYLQEQNSLAGLANRLLSKRAKRIFTAYENMERYFPKHKIELTGNPLRRNIDIQYIKKEEAMAHWGLDKNKKTLVVVGGSLGAKSINEALQKQYPQIVDKDIQIVWQTGRLYYDSLKAQVQHENIKLVEFIENMPYAYKVADVLLSRAGALTISELCLAGLAAVLVPSPNVAEGHQLKNAMYLKEKGAADYIPDHALEEQLVPKLLALFASDKQRENIRENARKNAFPAASETIANRILTL